MIDLLEGESEDMERRFWVDLEDIHNFLHLFVYLSVALVTQQLFENFWEFADDLDVLEGDIQLCHSFRASKLDDLDEFSLTSLGNDCVLKQFEYLAEEVVFFCNLSEQVLEGSVGVTFP